ncbi:hypothetical protein WJX73_003462 [Symbiochloris irregularis]|uniref:Thioredoxin domain-containing protein n=1 Tax=Symbiochloris irregularis TaxID=706552 RepID=A0AAW1NZ41_9CHLO
MQRGIFLPTARSAPSGGHSRSSEAAQVVYLGRSAPQPHCLCRWTSSSLCSPRQARRLGHCPPVLAAPAAVAEAPTWAPERELWDGHREEQYNELLERFKSADTNKNGRIDRKELKTLLERVNCDDSDTITGWWSEDDIDKVMQHYDTDESGDIDYDEFQVLARDKVLLRGKLEEYEQAFRAVDKDKKGKIGAAELNQLFQDLKHPVTYEKLVSIMKQYDVDHSGEIEFGEFLRMFQTELLDLQEVLTYIQGEHPEADEASQAAAKDFAGEVRLIFSEKDLDELLKDAGQNLSVLMSTVTWCRPCKAMQKSIQSIAQHYTKGLHFLKLYGNQNDECKSLFKDRLLTRVTPTFFFFKDGQIIHSHTGANRGKLEHYIRQHMPNNDHLPEHLFPVQLQPTGQFK